MARLEKQEGLLSAKMESFAHLYKWQGRSLQSNHKITTSTLYSSAAHFFAENLK